MIALNNDHFIDIMENKRIFTWCDQRAQELLDIVVLTTAAAVGVMYGKLQAV